MNRIKICLLLFSFFFFSKDIFCQTASDSTVITTDNMYEYLSSREESQPNIDLKNLIDSIKNSAKKEGDAKKENYAEMYWYYKQALRFKTIDSVAAYYKTINRWVVATKDAGIKALYKFILGDMLFNNKDYSTGIDMMLEAISECEIIGFSHVPQIGFMLYDLSNHYYNFSNYNKSIEYDNIAIKYKFPGSGVLNTWGMSYQKLGIYDSAALMFQQAVEKAQKEKSLVWVSIANGNLGRTYCLQKKYDKGLPLLYFDVIANQNVEPVNSAISALYMADAFVALGKKDSAWYYVKFAKKIFLNNRQWSVTDLSNSNFGNYYYTQLAKILGMDGDYYAAFNSLDSAIIFKEKYLSRFDWPLINSAEKRVQGLEYQQNLALLEAQKRNEKLKNIFLFIIIGALIIMAVLFISRQRIKYKKENQLMLLRQTQADKELANAEEKLNEYVKNISEKNNLIEKITIDLENISQKQVVKEEQGQLTEALHQLTNASLLTNEQWQEFQLRFDKVHHGFFAQLSVSVPGITPAEQRLLALSKLKINNREMSMMLGISPGSIRTAKYRLRKKLSGSNQNILEDLLDIV